MTFRVLRRRRSMLIALPLGAVFIGAALTGSTLATFSDSGSTSGSTYSAGTVVLTNNDSASSTVSFSGLQPGSTGSKCFLVTSTGTLPATVKMYLSTYTSTNGIGDYLNFTVTMGTGTSQTCSDFTPLSSGAVINNSSLSTARYANNYASGLGNWTLTGTATETRTYQVAWSIPALAPASTQNATATIGLTWEGRTAS